MRVQITLTGERADTFLERKAQLEDQLGHETSRAEAVMLLTSPAGDAILQQSAVV
ncbi:hypothetical protein OB905_11795 [Halobacteria archaeon AArc-dxtr1]|nr:hypothetical protein [Halobacteria archaeon AArc-dxtr1]